MSYSIGDNLIEPLNEYWTVVHVVLLITLKYVKVICMHIELSVECLHKNKANIYIKLHTTLLRLCWIVTIKTPSFPSRNTIRHLALLSRQNTGVAVINIDRYFFPLFSPLPPSFQDGNASTCPCSATSPKEKDALRKGLISLFIPLPVALKSPHYQQWRQWSYSDLMERQFPFGARRVCLWSLM